MNKKAYKIYNESSEIIGKHLANLVRKYYAIKNLNDKRLKVADDTEVEVEVERFRAEFHRGTYVENGKRFAIYDIVPITKLKVDSENEVSIMLTDTDGVTDWHPTYEFEFSDLCIIANKLEDSYIELEKAA